LEVNLTCSQIVLSWQQILSYPADLTLNLSRFNSGLDIVIGVKFTNALLDESMDSEKSHHASSKPYGSLYLGFDLRITEEEIVALSAAIMCRPATASPAELVTECGTSVLVNRGRLTVTLILQQPVRTQLNMGFGSCLTNEKEPNGPMG
jgi:hypothetical protein